MSNTTICLNGDCLTVNSINSKFCEKCGQQLLLRNRYQAIKLIGQGGFGRTFLAKDLDKPSKSYCVIKQFLATTQGQQNIDKASELFAQEGKRLEQLGKHPQIPELFAYFVENDQQAYLVQEYIAGQNLQDELKNQGVYKEIQIIELLLDILKILNFIHKNQVIHRDIKPENIIRRSSDGKLVLVDFGAAKHFSSPTALNVTGTVIGSAQYCSPEQARGKPVFASDLYSLGVTCIHLLTNVDPFQLFDISENDWVWQSYLVNNSVSQELVDILNKLIVVGLKQRFQSVQAVWQVLTKHHLIAKLPANNSLTVTNVAPVASKVLPAANTLSVAKIPQVPATVAKTVTTAQQKVLTTVQLPPIEVFELGEWGKLEMIYISAGSFEMGNNHRQEEKPLHTVNIQPFYMSKYQITQIQYKLLF
ncbi:MAG: protein kinase domain-containing protein, partial [Microcoleaceae cyanobacterium]